MILENINDKYKWIGRNGSGTLWLFEKKPIKPNGDLNFWISHKVVDLTLFNHLFQFIQWSDDEPYNIKELLEVSHD